MKDVLAVVNQKGGVGKTTTAVNLTAALGIENKKVLLVDLDPQGNSTSGMGITKKDFLGSTYDILILKKDIEKVILKTKFKNIYFIPSDVELAGAEIEMINIENRAFLLKQSIDKIKHQYDIIIIDCPPSLGILTLNALSACNGVIIPVQCEYYALECLSKLVATMKQVKKIYNKDLYIDGVLLTMYDGRLKLTIQVVNEIKKFFLKKIYKSVIPKNVKLSEAPSYGEPISYYDKTSKGCIAYKNLAKEILKNREERKF